LECDEHRLLLYRFYGKVQKTGSFMDQEIILDTLDATADFAVHLAGILRGGDVLALYGDLGAGKTALARLLIQALTNPNMIVPSPTFTLVQEYDSCHQDIKVIRHYDLYRLADESELVELGCKIFPTSVVNMKGNINKRRPVVGRK